MWLLFVGDGRLGEKQGQVENLSLWFGVNTMKYFVDFEFNEYRDNKEHSILDVISVGVVSEDGRTLYLQSCEF
jgi:hypothetical protein